MTESRFSVVHVRMTSDRPFADVQAAFERRLGRFEPDVYQALAEGGDPEGARARIETMAGSTASCCSARATTGGSCGSSATAEGRAVRRRQPAVRRRDDPARHRQSLYAPLRVLIYEADDGKTCIEYDRPSSLFGQFGDERVGRMAAALDQKLEDLAATATR